MKKVRGKKIKRISGKQLSLEDTPISGEVKLRESKNNLKKATSRKVIKR